MRERFASPSDRKATPSHRGFLESAWRSIRESSIGQMFFPRRKPILAPEARVTLDARGDMATIEHNERAEALSLVLEISGENQEVWRRIRDENVFSVMGKDAEIRERIQEILDRSERFLVFERGEKNDGESEAILVREGDTCFTWIARVNSVLRREISRRRRSRRDKASEQEIKKKSSHTHEGQGVEREDDVQEDGEDRRFSNSLIARIFYDDFSHYRALRNRKRGDIFEDERSKKYQDRIVELTVEMNKKLKRGRELVFGEDELLADWLDRMAKLGHQAISAWPIGSAEKMARALTGDDESLWKRVRDARYQNIDPRDQRILETGFQALVEKKKAMRGMLLQNILGEEETMEIAMQRLSHPHVFTDILEGK